MKIYANPVGVFYSLCGKIKEGSILKGTICKWPWIWIGFGLPWWLRWCRICLQRGWPGFNPGSGRSTGKGNGYLLQYSCLKNSMYWGAWWATVHGVAKNWHDWVTNHTNTHIHTWVGFRAVKMGWKKAFKTWKYHNKHSLTENMGVLWWFGNKEFTWNAGDSGDVGSIPGLGRSPEEGHGNPLQYSCWKKFMDRGAWQATVHGVVKSGTWLKRLSPHTQWFE